MQDTNALGSEKLGRLMLRLSLPSILAQLVNILYNLVDRVYIGRIPETGSLALTGLGVSLPMITLVSAFVQLTGIGGAPLAAMHLGAGEQDRAEHVLSVSCKLLILTAVLCMACFLPFRRPLLMLFGASEETIGYADAYMGIYLMGTLSVNLSLGLNAYISAQGQAKIAMLSVMIGAAVNIALDPLFIFTFGMGVQGAALATVLAQTVSAVWVVGFLCSKRSAIRLKLNGLSISGRTAGRIVTLGVSPFIMSATESAINIAFNRQLLTYGGDLYVASMTVLSSVMQIISVPQHGFTQGVQPIISYNYGAGKFDRVLTVWRRMTAICLGYCVILGATAVLLPGFYARIFTNDPALIEIVRQMLPIYIAGAMIFGVQISCQCTFVGVGQAGISIFIACLRKLILLIPLVLILPLTLGIRGVYLAEPLSDATSALCAFSLFLIKRKKIFTDEERRRKVGRRES